MKQSYENHIDVYGYGSIVDRGEERVEFTSPFPTDDQEANFSVTVNGNTTVIKRGETVMITRAAAEALISAGRQERAAAEARRGLSSK